MNFQTLIWCWWLEQKIPTEQSTLEVVACFKSWRLNYCITYTNFRWTFGWIRKNQYSINLFFRGFLLSIFCSYFLSFSQIRFFFSPTTILCTHHSIVPRCFFYEPRMWQLMLIWTDILVSYGACEVTLKLESTIMCDRSPFAQEFRWVEIILWGAGSYAAYYQAHITLLLLLPPSFISVLSTYVSIFQ